MNSPKEQAIADPTIPPPDMIMSCTSSLPESSPCCAVTKLRLTTLMTDKFFSAIKHRPRLFKAVVAFVSLCMILSNYLYVKVEPCNKCEKPTHLVVWLIQYDSQTIASPWTCPDNIWPPFSNTAMLCWQALQKTYFRAPAQSQKTILRAVLTAPVHKQC